VQGRVDFNHLFIQLASPLTSLLKLSAQHFVLAVLVVKKKILNSLHLVFKLVHHVFSVGLVLSVASKTLLEGLALVIGTLHLHF
jgi:hypothetical protein